MSFLIAFFMNPQNIAKLLGVFALLLLGAAGGYYAGAGVQKLRDAKELSVCKDAALQAKQTLIEYQSESAKQMQANFDKAASIAETTQAAVIQAEAAINAFGQRQTKALSSYQTMLKDRHEIGCKLTSSAVDTINSSLPVGPPIMLKPIASPKSKPEPPKKRSWHLPHLRSSK